MKTDKFVNHKLCTLWHIDCEFCGVQFREGAIVLFKIGYLKYNVSKIVKNYFTPRHCKIHETVECDLV